MLVKLSTGLYIKDNNIESIEVIRDGNNSHIAIELSNGKIRTITSDINSDLQFGISNDFKKVLHLSLLATIIAYEIEVECNLDDNFEEYITDVFTDAVKQYENNNDNQETIIADACASLCDDLHESIG